MPFTGASSGMEQAISALRKIGTTNALALAEKLYPKLIEYQSKCGSEMISFRENLDSTEGALQVQSVVAGMSLFEALREVARMASPPSKGSLRKMVENSYGKDKLLGMFSVTTRSPTGKIVAQRPQFESTEDARETATIAEMTRQSGFHQQIVARGYIHPALCKIHEEHYVRERDFYQLAYLSEFVLPGREMIVARGLHAGFQGDLIVSTHLLIPQIEESIRRHLERRGANASGFNRKNLQNEFDLNTTLYMREAEQLFDEDTLFGLRALLVDHHGSNLRNIVDPENWTTQ